MATTAPRSIAQSRSRIRCTKRSPEDRWHDSPQPTPVASSFSRIGLEITLAESKPLYHRLLKLDERADGRRADAYLAARFTLWSRSTLARHLAAGLILRHGRPIKPATILRGTDELEIYAPGLAPDGPPPPCPPILYEDALLLVLDKPAGMLPHPAGQRFVYSVINLARAARPGQRIDLVHRLDRDTSGILVLTKNIDANAFLKERLKHRRGFHKEYLALVRGAPAKHPRLGRPGLGKFIRVGGNGHSLSNSKN